MGSLIFAFILGVVFGIIGFAMVCYYTFVSGATNLAEIMAMKEQIKERHEGPQQSTPPLPPPTHGSNVSKPKEIRYEQDSDSSKV